MKKDKDTKIKDTGTDGLFDETGADTRAGPGPRHKRKGKPKGSVFKESDDFGFKEAESEYTSSEEGYFKTDTHQQDPKKQLSPRNTETETKTETESVDVPETGSLTESANESLTESATESIADAEDILAEDGLSEEKKADGKSRQREEYRKLQKDKAREKRDKAINKTQATSDVSAFDEGVISNDLYDAEPEGNVIKPAKNTGSDHSRQSNLKQASKKQNSGKQNPASSALVVTGDKRNSNHSKTTNVIKDHGNRNMIRKTGSTSLSVASYSTGKARSTISKATGEKDDSASADALGFVDRAGSDVVRFGFYTADDLIRPAAGTAHKTSEFTIDSMFETTKQTVTKAETEKAAYKKKMQHRRASIRRKAKKAEKAGKTTAKKLAEETVSVAKAIGSVIIRRGRILLLIVAAILIIIIFGGQMSGSTINIVTEVASVVSMATYQSSPQMIDEADLQMSYKELMLRAEIDEIEENYPDYDEYSYTIGAIGHDPFTLINFLHAQFGTINDEAMNYIDTLFDMMYELKLTSVQETRIRLVPKPPEEEEDEEEESDDEEDDEEEGEEDDPGDTSEDDGEEDEEEDQEPEYIEEEYTVNILKVELNSRSLEGIVTGLIEGDPTRKAIYNILNKSHGLTQYIGSPVFYTWSVESYYGYRRNPLGDYPELHRGLDIALPFGTSVNSAIEGFVKEIGDDPMYGDYIVISDEIGHYTVKYANMSSISVIVDERVFKGQRVGYSGRGGSEPDCLHMEFLVNGSYYNPLFYTENPRPETG